MLCSQLWVTRQVGTVVCSFDASKSGCAKFHPGCCCLEIGTGHMTDTNEWSLYFDQLCVSRCRIWELHNDKLNMCKLACMGKHMGRQLQVARSWYIVARGWSISCGFYCLPPPAPSSLNSKPPDIVLFTQEEYFYVHLSAVFEWMLSVNLELFELSFAVEFCFFSSFMLSKLLSRRDEQKPLVLAMSWYEEGPRSRWAAVYWQWLED